MQQYTIQPNDTLYLISRRFRIPLVQLIKANPGIENPNLINIGQIITIPDLPPIPEQLNVIESNAEGIMDDIYAKDWQMAQDKANVMNRNMNELLPLLREASVPERLTMDFQQSINRLAESLPQENTLISVSRANQVTRFIPDILDYFMLMIPTDFRRLKFLGRQIILDVEGKDWPAANNNHMIAKRVWERLKPGLDTRFSSDIANIDQVLNHLTASINRRNYQDTINNANRMLGLVEVLEADFR